VIAYGLAGDDDLAVRLKRERRRFCIPAERRQDLAVAVEARVEWSVRLVADQGEVELRPIDCVTPDEDLPVRLNRDRLGAGIAAPDVGDEPAVSAEARVEGAVGVVARNGESPSGVVVRLTAATIFPSGCSATAVASAR